MFIQILCRCREYAARQADLVPSYCNREEVEEAAVPRARSVNMTGEKQVMLREI